MLRIPILLLIYPSIKHIFILKLESILVSRGVRVWPDPARFMVHVGWTSQDQFSGLGGGGGGGL